MEVSNFFEYSDAVTLLNKWGDAYAKGTPLVSDAEYDVLYRKLLQFEKQYPDMMDKNSPTRKVHSDSVDGFIKVKHKILMGSIENSNGYVELEEWLNNIWNQDVREFVIENKMDGLSLSLHYLNGSLVDAITRGDGFTGDSVLANANQIKSIPKNLGTFTGEIRGECVMFVKDFDALQKRIEEEGGKLLKNPRNACSGSLKLHDPQEVKKRNLNFVAYSVVQGSKRPNQSDDLLVLKSHGFMISDYHVCKSVKEVLDAAHKMEALREQLPFYIDGLVIKVNDKELQNDLGMASAKYPRYFTALKFAPQVKETELIEVFLSASRTGAITPVAIVKPIHLGGTTVTKANLHNFDICEYLGLHIGATIFIQRAGDVIPEIIGVKGFDRTKTDYELLMNKDPSQLNNEIINLRKQHKDKTFILRPTTCQHCNSKLINPTNLKGETLVVLECPNPSCPIKQIKNIIRFCEKEAMNIFGMDEGILEKLLSNGLIKNLTDLYSLKKSDVSKLEGFGDRSAEKVVDAINVSRKNTLDQLIIGFGIDNCGKTLSPKLAEKFETLEKFSTITEKDLDGIADVGPETKHSILEWIKSNQQLMNFFITNNIGCKAKEGLKKVSNKLEGKTLIFSGVSEILERENFKLLTVANGGRVVSSVSSKLNYFVKGDSAGGSKLAKLQELPQVKIISPEEFLEMIK